MRRIHTYGFGIIALSAAEGWCVEIQGSIYISSDYRGIRMPITRLQKEMPSSSEVILFSSLLRWWMTCFRFMKIQLVGAGEGC